MIAEFSVDKTLLATHRDFGYASKIEGLKALGFSDGLNIVLGNNGSGKSTLARLIAAGCWADKAGFPHMTLQAMESRTDRITGQILLAGVRVLHDGQVLYIDAASPASPENSIGMFFGNVAASSLRSISHGEQSLQLIKRAFLLMRQVAQPEKHGDLDAAVATRLKRYKHPPSKDRVREIRDEEFRSLERRGLTPLQTMPHAVNDLNEAKFLLNASESQKARHARAQENFTSSLPKGRPTLLLDEPERSLSLVGQANLWALICNARVRQAFQIIIVSHSVFALEAINHVDGIRVHEMSPGYRDEASASLGAFRAHLPRQSNH